MAEAPTASTTGFAAVLIALTGPLVGEYMTIVLASLLGGFWALSARAPGSRTDGAKFLLRMAGTAVLFSSSAAYLIEQHFGWPARHALAGVAFAIAFYGDRWIQAADRAWDWAMSFFPWGAR